MKLCEAPELKVPAVVISNPYCSIFQVLDFTKASPVALIEFEQKKIHVMEERES